jgi:hypothetical protein
VSAFSKGGLNSYEWSIVFTALAALLVLNCLAYALQWLAFERPLKPDVYCWASVFSLLGGLVYLLAASLFFFFPSHTGNGKIAIASVAVQGALNLVATTIYLFSSLLYNSLYYEYRPGTWTRFFVEVLNTLPSFGYVCTAAFQVLVTLRWGIETGTRK